MEKLTQITVRGFRSFRELDLTLGDLTVLVGANGAGKSNLVAFFNMVSYLLSGQLDLYVARKGGASSLLHYGPKRSPVASAELVFESTSVVNKYGFTVAFAAPDRFVFTDEHLWYHNHGAPKPFTRTLGTGHLESRLWEIAGEPEDSSLRKVARVFRSRLSELEVYHFHDTSESANIRLTQDVHRNRELLSNGGNLGSFLYMLQEGYPAHFERIVSTVRIAVPYIERLILTPDQANPERILLRWRDRNSDYEFGPHQLSDGSLRAIALITALMQPEKLLPGVLVIDEPELGLHPRAVVLVGRLIKAVSAKRQVILSTQSPRLVAGFAPEDVVVADRLEDPLGYGESRFKRLTSDELKGWLTDYDLGALFEMNVTGGGPS